MILVVDAGVAAKWFIPEIFEVEASRLISGEYELHAPDLILPEFGNVIWKKVRKNEIAIEEGLKIVDTFQSVPIAFHSHSKILKAAAAGAFYSALTVYDWTYLSLAVAIACRFVTADEKFYRKLESTTMRKHLLWVGDL